MCTPCRFWKCMSWDRVIESRRESGHCCLVKDGRSAEWEIWQPCAWARVQTKMWRVLPAILWCRRFHYSTYTYTGNTGLQPTLLHLPYSLSHSHSHSHRHWLAIGNICAAVKRRASLPLHSISNSLHLICPPCRALLAFYTTSLTPTNCARLYNGRRASGLARGPRHWAFFM